MKPMALAQRTRQPVMFAPEDCVSVGSDSTPFYKVTTPFAKTDGKTSAHGHPSRWRLKAQSEP